ncbi:MAG: cupin-like domain-containing protein [Bacteroidia bacterium]|nr:cupin-like domain-containing protein [Bacteroidia bacterium]
MHDSILENAREILNNPLESIPQIETISKAEFHKVYTKTNTPVVMTKMMDSWPAKDKWDLDYFEKIGQDTEAYISKGNIRQEKTQWEYGKFLDYVREIKNYDSNKSEAYLSNLSITKLFPQLMDDVDFSFISDFKAFNSTSFWIGPPGTITGWHTDRLKDNILAQIYGKKLVLLASPQDDGDMCISDKYEPGSKLSTVSLEQFDPEKNASFKDVHVRYALLEPGYMLFIPKNWWHCVYGVTTSISSNNFGYTALDNFKMKTAELTKRMLHSLGLYGKDCVCHYYDENGRRHRR